MVEAPQNVIFGGRPLTESASHRLLDSGLDGLATILKRPAEPAADASTPAVGRFVVRIEMGDRPAYECTVLQPITQAEWAVLKVGATVDCKIDADRPNLAVLVPPRLTPRVAPRPRDSADDKPRFTDPAALITAGKRAVGTVIESEPAGIKVLGTADPIFMLTLELRCDEEPEPWQVKFGQRVPEGAEEHVSPGKELQVAYDNSGQDAKVSVDWPATLKEHGAQESA